MFELPNILNLLLCMIIVFWGTVLIVFISNVITRLIEGMTYFQTPISILFFIHLFIIVLLFNFLQDFIIYLELQKKIYNFSGNIYLDTVIIVGPTIRLTSNYFDKFVKIMIVPILKALLETIMPEPSKC